MRRILIVFGMSVCLSGCVGVSADAKKAVTLHNELYQSYAQDVRAGRTTPEQDRRFIVEQAAAMDELSRLLTSGPSAQLPRQTPAQDAQDADEAAQPPAETSDPLP